MPGLACELSKPPLAVWVPLALSYRRPLPARLSLKRERVLQAQLVAYGGELALDRLAHGHALVLAVEPDEVFLLAGGVDALLARGLLGGAQRTADVAGRLAEHIGAHEGLGIHHEEEVAQVVHLRAAVGRHAGECLHELAARQGRREDLDHGSVSVALVTCEFFAHAAQGSECRLASDERAQNLFAVGHCLAIVAHHHASGCWLTLARVILDFASLHNARGAVDAEWEVLIGVKREGEGVRAHHIFHAEGGGDGLAGRDAASVIAACKAIAPTFGGINLEDIKSPECFEIEETLERELDIPVFHDDQHGTAIVVTAALINALRVVGKKMEDVHIVLNGPGAAGTAIIKMLMTAGAKDIVAVDQFGTLYKGCNSAEAHKNWLGEVTNPRQIKGGLKEAIEGADVFIGVSRPGILTTELCKTMNKDAIVFAMANPTPEIMPDEAKAGGVRVMATGRSDFPNQVNNVLCFPGLFKGALSVRARDINNEMKLAAAYAIADLITDADRSEENIIPGAFDPRVAEAVAAAVAKAARETGVARL